ncbi:MAG: M3 family oligoendopeptidase [Chitinophagales bacterium]
MSETAIVQIPKKPKRNFLPQDFKVQSWEQLSNWFEKLENREINSVSELEQWLKDFSELESVIGEDMRWRYVKMTCNTDDTEARESLEYFQKEVEPELKKANFRLNKKLLNNPFTKELDEEKYRIFLREIKNQTELHRDENIPLMKELTLKGNEYSRITGAMSIEWGGKELTMQQAAKLLKNEDRAVREKAYKLIQERRNQDVEKLDKLFDEQLELRQKIAENAGFDNFRDYKFRSMGRFDYTPEDCYAFHKAIREHVVPLYKKLLEEQSSELGLEKLRPWDLEANAPGKPQLEPFEDSDELIGKSISCLNQIAPFYGEKLVIMNKMGHLDLDSRKGKAPGGYNMGMPEIGVPFIFMNAAGTDRDVKTMVHEAGHAVHSFLSHPLELNGFKSFPSEVAELASMSMELFSMKHWDAFYDDEEALKLSKLNQLKGIIKILPWVATIDKFQHWIYTHKGHTAEERNNAWVEIFDEFTPGTLDYSGLEYEKRHNWKKQLHIFEVPFYYIEYGMAQLGAVAMWRQFEENEQQALDNYNEALKLGYTKSIGEIYERAGIRFDFSSNYVEELVDFLQNAYEEVQG